MLGNYPEGAANDPAAPWNQEDPELIDTQLTISQTLHKDFEAAIAEDSNLLEAYKYYNYTIEEMLKVLKKYVEADMNNSSYHHNNLKNLYDSIDGWYVDETEVVEC